MCSHRWHGSSHSLKTDTFVSLLFSVRSYETAATILSYGVSLLTIAAKNPGSVTSSKQKGGKSKTKDRSSSSTPEDNSNAVDNISPVRGETTTGRGSHEDDLGDAEESVPVVEPKTPKSRKSKKATGSKADSDNGGNKKGKNGGAGVSYRSPSLPGRNDLPLVRFACGVMELEDQMCFGGNVVRHTLVPRKLGGRVSRTHSSLIKGEASA